MIDNIEKLEIDVKKLQEKEKQDTGFNKASTLAALEIVRLIKLKGNIEN